MTSAPSTVVFDVNETLSDLAPMADRFRDVGAAESLSAVWFASLLRDGFALTAAGAMGRFSSLGHDVLRGLLAPVSLSRDLDDAVEHIMGGFLSLPVHPDVATGVGSLAASGVRLVTLSNGSTMVADQLLTNAGLRDSFDLLLSAEDAGVWKPARGAYEYASRVCGTRLQDMLLVAAHPWDIDGAARAGMQTAWVNRGRASYPSSFTPPQYTTSRLDELPQQIR